MFILNSIGAKPQGGTENSVHLNTIGVKSWGRLRNVFLRTTWMPNHSRVESGVLSEHHCTQITVGAENRVLSDTTGVTSQDVLRRVFSQETIGVK